MKNPNFGRPQESIADKIKNLTYLKVKEARFVWFFAPFLIAIAIINIIYLPALWSFVNGILLFFLTILIGINSIKLIKYNLEVKASSLRLENIISNLKDGIIVYDANFKILVFNTAAEEIFSVKKEDVLGYNFGPERAQDKRFKLLAQTIFPSLAPMVVRRSEAGIFPQITDISFIDPNLELRVSTIKMSGRDGESDGFIKVVMDRTRELELYRSKSEFITVAAHQLRTPLTAVNWALELLNRNTSLSEEDISVAKDGFLASKKLLKIVDDLLDVSKIEEGKFGYSFENVDLISFLEKLLENASIVAKKYGANVYFDKKGEKSMVVTADPNRINTALSNIIDNAIKYNTKNGSVTVRVERMKDKPFVEIVIEDTGIGIPAEDIPQLFKKFFRSDNAVKLETEGSGLGLYITKNIIMRHGGTIWAESTIGRGTSFHINLPTDPKLIPAKEVVYGE
ncbi:MAG TPA: ATP-binding protein [Candidatus Paceibacterota bacterium]